MRRVVIHPGMAKTGTSALQRFLWQNRERLEALGWTYPDQIMPSGDPRQQFLLAELRAGRFPVLRSWLQKVSGNLVLSTEGICVHLFRLEEEQPELRALLADVDVDVVVYHRHAEAWSKSFYKQKIVNGESVRPYRQFVRRPPIRFLRDRDAVNAKLAGMFGGRLISLTYDEEYIVASFLRVLGVPEDGWIAPPERVNVSIPDAEAEVRRQLRVNGTARFRRNPPLSYTREEFDQAVARLVPTFC